MRYKTPSCLVLVHSKPVLNYQKTNDKIDEHQRKMVLSDLNLNAMIKCLKDGTRERRWRRLCCSHIFSIDNILTCILLYLLYCGSEPFWIENRCHIATMLINCPRLYLTYQISQNVHIKRIEMVYNLFLNCYNLIRIWFCSYI